MLLHSQTYRNHMNESISLTIRQYRSNGSHCKISIRRDELGARWFLIRLLLYFTIAQCATIIFCWNKLQIRFLWTLCLLAIVALLLYIFSPAKEESLMLLDNLNGIEYEKQNLFGKCSSTFLNTNQIIINEGITMQRVIFYLVAIPICLQHLILDKSEINKSTTTKKSSTADDTEECQIVSEAKLIPLFMSTLPRLDCLKVIYSYIIKYRLLKQQIQPSWSPTGIKFTTKRKVNSMDGYNLLNQFSRQILKDVLPNENIRSESLSVEESATDWPHCSEGTSRSTRDQTECDLLFNPTISLTNINPS